MSTEEPKEPEQPKSISVDDALSTLRDHLRPEPKTYEQGLEEGVLKGRREATEAAEAALRTTIQQVDRFSQAHGDTAAGRALGQIKSDTQSRLDRLVNGGD